MRVKGQNKWTVFRLTCSAARCILLALLFATISPTPSFSQGTLEQRIACTPDVFRLCSAFIPNADEITTCLKEKNAELSDACMQSSTAPNVSVGRLLPVFPWKSDIVRHITERKRAEEALRNMQMQLARANRVATMGQLSASIAHEVKQPITAAVTYALAARRFLEPAAPLRTLLHDEARRHGHGPLDLPMTHSDIGCSTMATIGRKKRDVGRSNLG